MNLAVGILFSEEDHNHSFDENIEKCLIDLVLTPRRRGTEKIFSLFYCLHRAYTETDWKGELGKLLIFWWAV